MPSPERPPRGPGRFRPSPTSVAGQLVLLVLAAIVATHAITGLALFALREPWRADVRPGVAANRVAAIARILDATDPAARESVLASAAQSLPSLQLSAWDGVAPPADHGWLRAHPVIERLHEAFAGDLVIANLASEADGHEDAPVLRIGLRTRKGTQIRATLPDDALGPSVRNVAILTVLFLATTLTLLSVWATRALVAPLARVADAAEAFGTREPAPPLPSRGPDEVRALAGALDRMRARVNRLLDDRTQMLAAIGHDLRTPITRLRLRAEFIEDPQARERTLHDLDQMNALVEAALAYARDEREADGAPGKDRPLIDVASLVQTVCDGFTDTGADVRMEEARQVLVRAHGGDLERALTNLVDNAVKYAGHARLSVARSAQGVTITVEDDGPGIPEVERQAMLQPFVRGDRSRNPNKAAGFGLGLSIVRAIVSAHGGSLFLDEAASGGLRVSIGLPGAGGQTPSSGRRGGPRAGPAPVPGTAQA